MPHASDQQLATLREAIRANTLKPDAEALKQLVLAAGFNTEQREAIVAMAIDLVQRVRAEAHPSLMESFLAEYGLTTKEGVALMCLAEALLRVPDDATASALIEDKILGGEWDEHLGQANSTLVNTATWGLMVAARLFTSGDGAGLGDTLRALAKRLGDPMIRTVAHQAMKEMGRQFVLGQTIEDARDRARKQEERGYSYSYDMLGEAARTRADAERYFASYSHAIESLADRCCAETVRDNPGISIKLSALHPRYEYAQRDQVMLELVPVVTALARRAAELGMGFNIDAEEADRLDLSLDVIGAVLAEPALAGWDGFGVVVQAYGQRAPRVLDWLYALAVKLDRRLMVRLVKGAYWDAEIKRAQVLGLDGFPVYTRKAATDLAYMACAKQLLAMTDRIYPQFATHNAHSVASILHLASDASRYEFQRLHGMGEALYDVVRGQHAVRCRIYAPVGQHEDLLAYLVRRLLENGANSSFVNQIMDESIAPARVVRDPVAIVESWGDACMNPVIATGPRLFGPQRINAKGWDLTDPRVVEQLLTAREQFRDHSWRAQPLAEGCRSQIEPQRIYNPADLEDWVGEVVNTDPQTLAAAVDSACAYADTWSATLPEQRARCLNRYADLLEQHACELFAIAAREAGKTLADAIAEVREAVDFARYYANDARALPTDAQARGVMVCISPWNFPLAIFTGQIMANLAAGNVVLAKPAPQTPIMAWRAVQLMHEAGIPPTAIQLLPGDGAQLGAALVSEPRVAGVCFTGSTQTAQHIYRAMADHLSPQATLVAETGGLNAMIVDSTALPEQVVRDVIASAFQSAGQRCSALRLLYVQEDVAEHLLSMLQGAMDCLRVADPWQLEHDIGPVIDRAAQQKIMAYCESCAAEGRMVKQLPAPGQGYFVAPTLVRVAGIEDLAEEIFGPVLHVATFRAEQLDDVVRAINRKGYGLTFGLHTRVDSRVEQICERIAVGNVYVNRNQIGAIVGSQPFGGEGLSGTGPKAGGPSYVARFLAEQAIDTATELTRERGSNALNLKALQDAVTTLNRTQAPDREQIGGVIRGIGEVPTPSLTGRSLDLPGPTGEVNRLRYVSRGTLLCLGPTPEYAAAQAAAALSQGNRVLIVCPGMPELDRDVVHGLSVVGAELSPADLTALEGIDGVLCAGDDAYLRELRRVLAARDGRLLPLIIDHRQADRLVLERHVCVDTTAAGGNASLIAASS